MRRSQEPPGEAAMGSRGVTILEVLIAAVVTAIGLTAIMHFLALSVVVQIRSEEFWREGVEKWNRSQLLRSRSGRCGELEAALEENAGGLERFELEGDKDDEGRRWEVLVACRQGFYPD